MSLSYVCVMSRITDSTRRHIIPSRTGITLIVEQCMLNMEQCMLNMEQCMLVAQANMLLFSEICSRNAFFNYAFLMLQKADYAKRNASIMGLSLHTSFLKTLFGDLGRLSSLELATEPSPLHSADGSSTASI